MESKMREDGITHKLLNDITGADLVHGSANIVLDHEIEFPLYAGRVERRDFTKEFGDTIYITSALLNGIDGWAIRHLLVDRYDGPGNRRRVVEFVSDVHVRSALGIGDGDEVVIRF